MPSERYRASWGTSKVQTQPDTKLFDSLDPDYYLGTLGLAADAPVGALKPHYTTFPAADAGQWVRVVSDTKIDGIDLVDRQEWICLKDKTPEKNSANWELCQTGSKKLAYATHAYCIGDIRRQLDKDPPFTLTSEIYRNIPFLAPVGTGFFKDRIASDQQLVTTLTDLYEVVGTNIVIDIYLYVMFQTDLVGDRLCSVNLASYYPIEDDKFSVLLETHQITSDSATANKKTPTNISLFRPRLIAPVTEPLDEQPITHAIYCNVEQNSGTNLELQIAELKVIAWA